MRNNHFELKAFAYFSLDFVKVPHRGHCSFPFWDSLKGFFMRLYLCLF